MILNINTTLGFLKTERYADILNIHQSAIQFYILKESARKKDEKNFLDFLGEFIIVSAENK